MMFKTKRKMDFSYEMYMVQGFITDQETAMEELYGNIENTRRFNTCLNNMAIRIATVFASLKVYITDTPYIFTKKKLHTSYSIFVIRWKILMVYS